MTTGNATIRFEPNDQPPHLVSAGLAAQIALMNVAWIVITPSIVVRAADGSELFLGWSIFAAMVVCAITTALQAIRYRRIGSGHLLFMGPSAVFMAVSVTAIAEGGPATLTVLIILSSLVQFLLAARLSLLRKIVTPTVAGTVIMLIPVSVMPMGFDLIKAAPEGTTFNGVVYPCCITLFIIVVWGLRAKGLTRLWIPIVAIVIGCIVSSFFGAYKVSEIVSAPWVGLPSLDGWPGFDLSFGPVFWSLLPAFLIVTVIGATETVGDSIAIQNVSRKTAKSPDYRVVQGALNADGVGNLLSGILGTIPNTTYSNSISVVEFSGVAARHVGVWVAIIVVLLALLPKVTAVLLAIPDSVVFAYLLVMFAMLFVVGVKMAVSGGFDYRQSIVVGVSFWVGLGFQNQLIFPDLLSGWLATFLENGMTSGGLCAILLTGILHAGGRRERVRLQLEPACILSLQEFLRSFAERMLWSDEASNRLALVLEEVVTLLIENQSEGNTEATRSLSVTINTNGQTAELEFIASSGRENLSDRVFMLSPIPETPSDQNLSLRIIRHLASTIRHQQYYDTDVVLVTVQGMRRRSDAGK